jgi:SAM-dependent methyltransferase
MIEDRDALYAYLLQEYNQPFSGWDFSYLNGRYETIHASDMWDYKDSIRKAMASAQSLLDIDTGGGEFLASLQPLPLQTCATESYPPNIPVARQRLEPLGVTVYAVDDKSHVPFVDNQFDLIICRHGSYAPPELLRILKSGRQFITQQVGGETNKELHILLDAPPYSFADWTLQRAANELEQAGFQVLEQREAFLLARYYDIGALVYYLKAIPWQIPDFSVEKYFDKLLALHKQIQQQGAIEAHFHQFFIIAQKAL